MKNFATQILLVLLIAPFLSTVSQSLPRKNAQPTVCFSGEKIQKADDATEANL